MSIVMDMEKPASVLKAENAAMVRSIVNHFMKVLNCKDVHDLIETCETIIDTAKKTNYYLAE